MKRALDMTTMTIMRPIPREVDPTVFNMINEESSSIDFSEIGGLNEQIRELQEVIELPLANPELFIRVGIKAPLRSSGDGENSVGSGSVLEYQWNFHESGGFGDCR
jgi:ATP-dependent 26S proteasome regulatory subunit